MRCFGHGGAGRELTVGASMVRNRGQVGKVPAVEDLVTLLGERPQTLKPRI